MIRYSDEEGFIKPKGIKFRDGQDRNIRLPRVAVGVFSRHLFYDVVKKFKCKEIGYISAGNFEKNIYLLDFDGTIITFFMAGVSGPHISADIEELRTQGVEKFIIFGNCGVLDSNIEDCSIIIPTKAFRDEGTSYHYIKESDNIDLSQKYTDEFIKVLKEFSFEYTKGYTWTTDAFYRETRDKIQYFRDKGAVCVEMEGSVIAAVCKRYNLDYFTFYYAGDNLDSVEWDERSLHGLSEFNKKQKVMKLALTLAKRIDD